MRFGPIVFYCGPLKVIGKYAVPNMNIIFEMRFSEES